jgi:hypothetical protein
MLMAFLLFAAVWWLVGRVSTAFFFHHLVSIVFIFLLHKWRENKIDKIILNIFFILLILFIIQLKTFHTSSSLVILVERNRLVNLFHLEGSWWAIEYRTSYIQTRKKKLLNISTIYLWDGIYSVEITAAKRFGILSRQAYTSCRLDIQYFLVNIFTQLLCAGNTRHITRPTEHNINRLSKER